MDGNVNLREERITVIAGSAKLKGDLVIPEGAEGIVIFAHGSGSNRHSKRDRFIAQVLRQEAGLATLLIDLLTPDEAAIDTGSRHFRFDIKLLARRLVVVTDWLRQNPLTHHLKVGYFAASTGSGAALVAAAAHPICVEAIVSRSGELELACFAFSHVQTPTLLIVGGDDFPVMATNEDALVQIPTQNKQLEIIPRATHLFEEPGAMEEVAKLASQWFQQYLTPTQPRDSYLRAMSLNS